MGGITTCNLFSQKSTPKTLRSREGTGKDSRIRGTLLLLGIWLQCAAKALPNIASDASQWAITAKNTYASPRFSNLVDPRPLLQTAPGLIGTLFLSHQILFIKQLFIHGYFWLAQIYQPSFQYLVYISMHSLQECSKALLENGQIYFQQNFHQNP